MAFKVILTTGNFSKASLLFKIGKSRSHVDHWLTCHGVPVATIESISVLGCSICGITSPVAWEGGCRMRRARVTLMHVLHMQC